MKRKIKVVIVIAVLIILAVLGAIIFLAMDYRDPDTSVDNMNIMDMDDDLKGFRVMVILEINNPNIFQMDITGVEGTILLDSSVMGDLKNETGVSIAGKSKGKLDVIVHVDDVESSIFSAKNLSIKGVARARYLGKRGTSNFHYSVGLDDLLVDEKSLSPKAVIIGPHVARTLSEVTLDGSTSIDSDGEIVSYSWNLGDGNTAEGAMVNHRYMSAGTYTIELTVRDDQGVSSTATHQLIVSIIPI